MIEPLFDIEVLFLNKTTHDIENAKITSFFELNVHDIVIVGKDVARSASH